MDTPNSTPLAPLAGHPNQGAQSLRSWLNANGGKLGLGLTALVALSLMPFASLTTQAFAMIVAFMALIMTKRMSVLTALIIVPIVFALLGGFGPEIGPMMLDGVKAIAPTAAMLMFAILFFGIMIDVGLFDPVVKLVVRAVHGDPMRIVVGTAVLALVVSLDGDGSTTYLIATAAMLPLYTRLGSEPVDARVRRHDGRRRDEHSAVGRTDGSRGSGSQSRRCRTFRPDDSGHCLRRSMGDLGGLAVRTQGASAGRSIDLRLSVKSTR